MALRVFGRSWLSDVFDLLNKNISGEVERQVEMVSFCCYDSCGWDNLIQAWFFHNSIKFMTDHYKSVKHVLFMRKCTISSTVRGNIRCAATSHSCLANKP